MYALLLITGIERIDWRTAVTAGLCYVEPGAGFTFMTIAGFSLLVAGWLLVILAVVLLRTETPRAVFVLAGMGVQVLALVLIFRAHCLPRGGAL